MVLGAAALEKRDLQTVPEHPEDVLEVALESALDPSQSNRHQGNTGPTHD
jgi:hypothetical protein